MKVAGKRHVFGFMVAPFITIYHFHISAGIVYQVSSGYTGDVSIMHLEFRAHTETVYFITFRIYDL